jgi:hypothetical protein
VSDRADIADPEIRSLLQLDQASPNAPQPPPTKGDGPAIWDLVIDDLEQGRIVGCEGKLVRLVVADARERDALGEQKYGRRLRAHDGRDNLKDAYQEAADLTVYLRKECAQAETAGAWTLYREALNLFTSLRFALLLRDGA